MQEVSFRLSPTFLKTAADANASLLAGYQAAFSAALGIPPTRIRVSVAATNGQGRRLLSAGATVYLLVVVQVVDYPQAVAVMDFAMTQSMLYAATRGARLPDLEFIPDSVVYAPGPGGTSQQPGTTAVPGIWKPGQGVPASVPARALLAVSLCLCALLVH